MSKFLKALFLLIRHYPEVKIYFIYELKFIDGSDCKIFTKNKQVINYYRKQTDVIITKKLVCRKGRY